MFVDIASLSVVDLLRSGALIVAFLATAFADKGGKSSIWVKADAICNAGFGLGLYLFPGVFLGYAVDGQLDDFHFMYCRMSGAMMISIAALYHLVIRDRDQAPLGTWLVSRTLASAAVLSVCCYGMENYSKGSVHLNEKFRSFAFLGHLLCFLGHVIHLFRFNDYANEGRGPAASAGDRTKFHLFIDLLFIFPWTFFVFGFTDKALQMSNPGGKYGGVHELIICMLVAMSLTGILFGLTALQSNSERDRRAYFLCKLLMFGLCLPVGVYAVHFKGLIDATSRSFMIQVAFNLLLHANAFFGAFYRQIEDRKRK